MKYFFTFLLLCSVVYSQKFPYRAFENVKSFYAPISKDIVALSVKYNTPPAAILAIAGLESGYGSGYVSQITGNIMSLGANKNDKQLPPLYLPYCANDNQKKTLFDPVEQKKCPQLIWRQRPESLKKDYRPLSIAGTTQDLAFFKKHPQQFEKAKLACVEDFLKIWLRINHKYAPFRETKQWLNEKVEKEGIETLFTLETNLAFISKIGGKANSFNYRISWTKKVRYILEKTGLNTLSRTLYYEKTSFDEAWEK